MLPSVSPNFADWAQTKRLARQAAMIAKLRDWYIVAIAVCAILAGLYLASGLSTPSGSATQATVAPSAQAPQSKIASQNPAPVAGQTPNAPTGRAVRPPAPAASAAPSQPAATIRIGDNTGDGRHALGCTHNSRFGPQSRHGGGRASGTNHSPGTSKDLEYGSGRWRCGSRPPGLQKMPGLPFAGARQEFPRPKSLGHRRQKVG